jgi:hypothetical protein
LNPASDEKVFIEEKYVRIRGIDKDMIGSAAEFSDYQFRPKVAGAMTVPSELFDPVHAVIDLNAMEERRMETRGMRTFDAAD